MTLTAVLRSHPGTNKVIGGIRLGQLRTDSLPCDLPEFLRAAHAESPDCAVQWEASLASTAPFGAGRTQYVSAPTDEQGEWHDTGSGSEFFPAPGFAVVLPNPARSPATVARGLNASIHQLRGNRFIDLNTRALLLDFATYNRNKDLLAMVRVVFKFPMLGGVDTDLDIMMLRAEQYRSSAGGRRNTPTALPCPSARTRGNCCGLRAPRSPRPLRRLGALRSITTRIGCA